MQGLRIGEILCEMGVLSANDVQRILKHQSRTRQKFGQIAVRWGLATQDQVWEAWARQFAARERLDLSTAGSDTNAWKRVPAAMARRFEVVPLRLWGRHLVVAGPTDLTESAINDLAAATGCQVHVCPAERSAVTSYLKALEALSVA
ncbi:MAG: hypothetical protein HRF43_19365 [Phycisphaerae bacterium]|jgi:type IV pilus assembly protein PilB